MPILSSVALLMRVMLQKVNTLPDCDYIIILSFTAMYLCFADVCVVLVVRASEKAIVAYNLLKQTLLI